MTPSDADILAALEVLDQSCADQIRILREGFERTMEAFKASRVTVGAGPSEAAATPSEWSPVERAMFFYIWKTSNAALEEQFARS